MLGELQTWIFEHAVEPLLYATNQMALAEDAYDGIEAVLLGAVEIALLLILLRPLERWRPLEHWSDMRPVRTDVIYTLLHRLGGFALILYFSVRPLLLWLDGELHLRGIAPAPLESWVPGLADHPAASFLVYLVILDFADYWRHRLQHRLEWWWALHALHHSQRQMSIWTDDRNHFLDDFIAAFWFAAVALAIGVPPSQFLLLAMTTRLVQSLAHINSRIRFGWLGERLLVSPSYHRRHHAMGYGHEGRARGCNFATLFPIWDLLFGTADFSEHYDPTGIRDQLDGRDYGEGLLRQQWLGFTRLARALLPSR
ncbi:MAG TPA: sterol desaturase family protein [Nevskiaceae bacterium]|nr:sterol desaturase family protein [Nevskiaceae bacterium]